MTALRAVLDRLNDIEATISQVTRDAGADPSFALRLSLQSLESRREMLQEELNEITQQEFVDICDYRIIPETAESYAISAVTGAWHDFQDILSLVFSSIEAHAPKTSAKLSQSVIQKTQLNFGYAYQGSLGIVMTIRNDRFLLDETVLDHSVAVVFDILKANSPESIRAVAHTYGVPVVKKLHHLSKMHSQYGMSAEIKWVKNKEAVLRVLAQPPEFAEICRIIESKSDVTKETITLTGTLIAWNTKTKAFVIEPPEGETISGRWADGFEGQTQRKVPARYVATLIKQTTVQYAEERDQVSWLLESLVEVG